MEKSNKKDYVLIFFASLLISVALSVFIAPNDIVAGGVSGLAVIIARVSHNYLGFSIPVWISNLAINIPLLILGYLSLGFDFIKKTMLASLTFSLGMILTDRLPEYTEDMLMACIFGGVLTGIGVGLILAAEGTSGGTVLFAAILEEKYKSISVSALLFILDTLVILIGLFTFGATKAMYAIIAVYISTAITSFVIEGFNISKALYIISEKSDDIAEFLMKDIDRGVTALKAKGMYSNKDKDVLLCIVDKRQIVEIKRYIKEMDENAFMIVYDVKEVLGEGFKKHR